MSTLREVLQAHVDDGGVPGAVGLIARGDRIETAAVGLAHAEGTTPMTRDSIFRWASITKPLTAAAVLMLAEDGVFGLHDPVGPWLPELAHPMVVRTPDSPIDEVVPAHRPITVFDLLSSQAGYGWASDLSLPAIQALFGVQPDGREPRNYPPMDDWLRALAQVPMLAQPGTAWLYDTCSILQGALVTRASGRSLPDFIAERILEPLGMSDTGFTVPEPKRDRLTSYYRRGETGLELADGPDGQWTTPPPFPLGNGGLAGTADDWLRFGRMLLADGVTPDGRKLLSANSVRLMTTDHTTPALRTHGDLFLEGQGWGFGSAIDIAPIDPWNVPGRYGWVGGSGTSAHLIPSTGTVAILLTQVGMDSPVPDSTMRDFWRYTAAFDASA
ncbi:serine hydrolase domain-containing protein [Nocardia sp. CDC153]|uniref:serine hydrolase domain-containing protein n=1 Tax=Nocardia sp. CDC153 TaxID=3112167 RepID=UPI002DB6C9E3|nr:serine hydrolase domain-containing protein [Nocardia sp. CDC153]MEC3956165.1 serine hydrolase domain-containing protein [Nocardia sp. CDC153]